MAFRFSAALLLAGSAAMAAGCSTTLETFQCETNADCASAGSSDGLCEPSQVCSFADPSCGESGRRYGSASGERSNECVGENADSPDAAGAIGDIDASDAIDAGGESADASVGGLEPDAGGPPCLTPLNLVVYDNSVANDFLRLKVNNVDVLECHPMPTSMGGGDSMGSCQYCMLVGDEMEIKAESGIRLSYGMTDCDPACQDKSSCKFTATEACYGVYVFDTTAPPI